MTLLGKMNALSEADYRDKEMINIKDEIMYHLKRAEHGLMLKEIRHLCAAMPYVDCRNALSDLVAQGFIEFVSLSDRYKKTDKRYINAPEKKEDQKETAEKKVIHNKGIDVIIKMRTGVIEEIHLSGETAIIDEALCVIAKYIRQDDVSEIIA